MKTIVIKCQKCGQKFTGTSFREMIKEHNLTRNGKYFYCDCGVPLKTKPESKKKRNSFKSDFFDGCI